MKSQFEFAPLFGIFILLSGFMPAPENKDGLPFTINYSLPLKTLSYEQLEKYDYAEYSAGEDIMQLKHYHNLTKEKAQKIVADRTFFILAMFKEQPSPYPGVLSNSIGCPKELQPKANEDTASVRVCFKLFATSNLISGNCNISDNYYYCAYILFFCQTTNDFFEVKIFTPIKNPSFDYENLIASIKCKG